MSKENLFYVAAKALVINDNNEILMVHLPEWSDNKAHWDLPGGRVDKGEGLLETLKRELIEELSIEYTGIPIQLTTFMTNITIPLNNKRIPLIYVVYKVSLPLDAKIKLDPNSAEEAYEWFIPKVAAKEMVYKFSKDFCKYISQL